MRSSTIIPYYGPYISSSCTTGKRHRQVNGGSAGRAGTSQAIGRGVTKSHNVTLLVWNVGTWERRRRTNVLTYQRT